MLRDLNPLTSEMEEMMAETAPVAGLGVLGICIIGFVSSIGLYLMGDTASLYPFLSDIMLKGIVAIAVWWVALSMIAGIAYDIFNNEEVDNDD